MAEYTHVKIRTGTYLAQRYINLLKEVSKTVGLDLTQRISQGSYNAGGVNQSGGTHDGGGAVDIYVRDLTQSQIDKVVKALRKYCAAWHRTPAQGNWGPHIHSIDVGATDLSYQARGQVRSYNAGYNGLASGQVDDGPDVATKPYDYSEGLMGQLDEDDYEKIANKVVNKLMNYKMHASDWAKDSKNPNTGKPAANVEGKRYEDVIGNGNTRLDLIDAQVD